ncbi:DUF6505 family protein [Oceanomicrobium pacificus]|uniref:Uncharacterized protein n=1 Tax=Oceanomicrobium pacificus TaxID=2692916 RepID=A0A6B0TZM3_9RHOB|nr:DUF6505 family protein [Oceanomicrobium pacificus]MXU66444.1 hypothetical protein [Oceanomicrobium pacificus]
MLLARTIHFDISDRNVYARPAESGEWAVSGGFEFSNWTEADLQGQARQAFAHGWLGLDSFGRASLVAVAPVTDAERGAIISRLADHFRTIYGAPDMEAATAAAEEELAFMAELCADQPPNAVLAVQRSLTEAGVREQFRATEPGAAQLEDVARHGHLD